jgi:hypothetical protein
VREEFCWSIPSIGGMMIVSSGHRFLMWIEAKLASNSSFSAKRRERVRGDRERWIPWEESG